MPDGGHSTLTINVSMELDLSEQNISMLVSPLCCCYLAVSMLAINYGDTFKGTKHSEHQKVMRGELRREILVCEKASGRAFLHVQQGTVTGEGKV